VGFESAPMGSVARILTASGSTTAITLLQQTAKSRRFWLSIARPLGP